MSSSDSPVGAGEGGHGVKGPAGIPRRQLPQVAPLWVVVAARASFTRQRRRAVSVGSRRSDLEAEKRCILFISDQFSDLRTSDPMRPFIPSIVNFE